jgi:hypothetical protein
MAKIPDIPDGWVINHEPKPSFNRHMMPPTRGHEMSSRCWCEPYLEGYTDRQPTGTLVLHRDDH